jgi:hypothetical protein
MVVFYSGHDGKENPGFRRGFDLTLDPRLRGDDREDAD